ncbi:hypothetical protein [Trinickia acidisoli]|uniref:hypothetical protein n=1 Tax=Trinickia acidisoli TaxID=2767482 RepID=UPI001A901B4C|nr:hypothetical protein [Trinickia acidisoli]
MKLPNWVRTGWWVILIVVLTVFLYGRYPDLKAGRAAAADVVVFVIWIALLLAPLFGEVSLLGIKLKQQFDELENMMTTQITDIRNDLRNTIDVRTTISPSFNIPAAPSDAQLPAIERRINEIISERLSALGVHVSPSILPINVDNDVSFLFAARYNLEKELRRIMESSPTAVSNADTTETVRRRAVPLPVHLRSLVDLGLIDRQLAGAIREVYSVCSPAIHGESVSKAQVAFVKDVAPRLIATLAAIENIFGLL